MVVTDSDYDRQDPTPPVNENQSLSETTKGDLRVYLFLSTKSVRILGHCKEREKLNLRVEGSRPNKMGRQFSLLLEMTDIPESGPLFHDKEGRL